MLATTRQLADCGWLFQFGWRPQNIDKAGGERRSDGRIRINEPATVHLTRPSTGDRITGRIVDVSQGGFRVRMLQPVLRGTSIHVRVRDYLVLTGVVLYSVKVGIHYDSGIALTSADECQKIWRLPLFGMAKETRKIRLNGTVAPMWKDNHQK